MLLSFLRREDKRLPLFNLQAKAVSLLPDCGAALGNCRYSRQLLQNRTSSQSKPIPQRSKLVLMMQRFILLYPFGVSVAVIFAPTPLTQNLIYLGAVSSAKSSVKPVLSSSIVIVPNVIDELTAEPDVI